MSSETGRQKLLTPINTYFQAWGARWARVSVGTWGTLKNTTNTKQNQKELVGICVSLGSCRRSRAVLWPDLTAQEQQPVPWPGESFDGTLVSAFGVAKRGCRFPPTFMEGDVCLSPQDVSWQWDNLRTPNIPQPQRETTLGSGESKCCREPLQKEMEVGRGERKCAGVLTIFLAKMEENRCNY